MSAIQNPVTGREKFSVTDNGVFDAITGRQIGIIEDGVVKSTITGAVIAIINGSSGGSIDLSFVTAGAGDILSGKIGADATGAPVAGSIPLKGAATITPGTKDQTIAAGRYLAGAQTIKGDADLIPENIAEGKEIFGVAGSFKGGADFYKCAAIHGPYDVETVVVSGCPVAEVNGNYLPTEFTTSDWEGNKQPVYSNGTYFYYYEPNNYMSWGISSNYTSTTLLYMGNIGSSWSDADWNPVEGMSAVNGTATLDTDVPKTWDGYKAVLRNGVYTFEDELTTGLTYSDVKPQKYGIYNADATIKTDWLAQDYPTANIVLFTPLTTDLELAEVGGAVSHRQTETLGTVADMPCTVFAGSQDGMYAFGGNGYIGAGDFTLFLQFAISTFNQGNIVRLRQGYTGYSIELGAVDNNNSKVRFSGGITYETNEDQWYDVVCVRREGKLFARVGNTPYETIANATVIDDPNILLGWNWFQGGIRNVLLYNRALSEDEVGQLVDKFGE